MLENHVKSHVTRKRLRESLAAPYIDEFSDWLHKQGYKPVVVDLRLRSLAGFSDWAKVARVTIENLPEGIAACKQTLKQRKLHSRGANVDSIVVATKFLRFLQERGFVQRPQLQPTPSQIWPILAEFRSWSTEHRGTQETTLDLYEGTLRDFVRVLGDNPKSYTAKAIREFVLNRARGHSVYRAQAISVASRAFLRFLAINGQCSLDIIYAVPTFPSFKLKSIPRHLEPADLKRVEEACQAQDENGLRDRAVILLLTRLGLRASDVANLALQDLDWKNGRIALMGKNRRQEWLPLPQEVGDAILRYLQEGRPKLKLDQVFTRVDAPLGPLTRASVTHVVRSALLRAKIKAPVNGAHVLRHSAATAMLRQGVSLAGVGAVLRHRSPSTTAIYAKVDFGLLSEVAQRWPPVIKQQVLNTLPQSPLGAE
jgi:integrase/recombinase XerD